MARRSLILLAGIILLAGCSMPVMENPIFARKVIDAVYAESLKPLGNSVSGKLQKRAEYIKTAGNILKERFGPLKDMTLDDARQETSGFTTSTWLVTAEKGQFLVILTFDQDRKLDDINFSF